MKVLDERDLSLLQSGNNQPLTRIFKENYMACLTHVKRICSCQTEDAEDLIMEAIMVLRDKILTDNFENTNVQSFLISVATNKWRNHKQKFKRVVFFDPSESERMMTQSDDRIDEKEGAEQKEVVAIRKALKAMEGKCGELLRKHLNEGIPLEMLVDMLNYKNYDVIKNTKSRCMKRLRESVRLNLNLT